MADIYSGTPSTCSIVDFHKPAPPANFAILAPMSAAAPLHTPPSSKAVNAWVLRLPILVGALLLLAIVGFIALSLNKDQQERRDTLLSDVLWLEQNLRFQFERNEEHLTRLAPELLQTTPEPRSAPLARQAVSKDSGIASLSWFDPSQHPRGAIPPLADSSAIFLNPQVAAAVTRAKALGKPTYSEPLREDGKVSIALIVPAYDNANFKGVLIAIYPLDKLINTQVAWWFSERYNLTILDASGSVLARKSAVSTESSELSYQLNFEPPGHGMLLRVEAYNKGTRLVPLLFAGLIIVCAAGLMWSLFSLSRHIRRRHAAENALRQEYSFRRAMEDSLHTGLRARDLKGKTTYVNRAFCEMVGWPAEELLGRSTPMPYWLPEELDATLALHHRVLAGEFSNQGFEIRFRRKSGEAFDALIHEAPLVDADGVHTGWMASIVDITDRKRAEELARLQQERLQATARLVTTGELASTLAHELNQPLAAIASYASGCIKGIERQKIDMKDLSEALKKMGHQAQRAGQIIHRIQNFVRRSEPRREEVDIPRVLQEAIELLDSSAKRRRVQILLAAAPPKLPKVPGDRLLIEQVVVNLMRNGMDAMLETATGDRRLALSLTLDHEYLYIHIRDHGHGLPAELAEKIYAPFFTTKSEGMGLGLSICRSVMEWHRGRLWFDAASDGGSIFHISLPLQLEEANA